MVRITEETQLFIRWTRRTEEATPTPGAAAIVTSAEELPPPSSRAPGLAKGRPTLQLLQSAACQADCAEARCARLRRAS